MLWKVFDTSSDSQRFLSDDSSDHLQSLESVPSPSEKSRGCVPDRHLWNSRTIDDHRETDRTQPISEGSSKFPVLDAERHQLAALSAATVDNVKDEGNMGLEATVRSTFR